MKEIGMIFNAEMVKAILSGRKTQTRRMIKPGSDQCPYSSGDRIWVRETFYRFTDALTMETCNVYRATDGYDCKWTPAIHMPRNASRITLEITNIRCEKLLDITEEDAIAEGLPAVSIQSYNGIVLRPAAFAFRELWMSIYGANSWDSNPYIWVIEFKILEWKK